MRKIPILLIFLFCIATNSFCGYYSEKQIAEMLQSENIQNRIMALYNLNRGLEKGELEITPDVKTILDGIIEDQIKGKNDNFTADVDEEGQYSAEIFSLMLKINDKKYLSYFMQSGFGPLVKKAIFKHGEMAYAEALKLSRNFNNMNSIQKSGYIVFMADMIDENREGFVARGEKRDRIKKIMMQIFNEIKFPDPKNKNYELEISDVSLEVISPFLTFFNVLGDKEVIPLVEKIAAENDYKKVYRKKYYKYLKMDPKELIKHQDETEKLFKEDDREKERMGASAFKNEEKVIEYPVRDKAKKILEELKKKNNVQ